MKAIQTGTMTIALLIFFAALDVNAKAKVTRKIQEVNFGDMSLKGTIRNPDGAYLVQKRGIKFLPLYDVQRDMDGRIRESGLYLK